MVVGVIAKGIAFGVKTVREPVAGPKRLEIKMLNCLLKFNLC